MSNTSVLTKNQKKIFGPKVYTEGGQTYRITAKLRFDDQCGNGHNEFSITGDIDRMGKNGIWYEEAGGCIHYEIKKHFPELAKYIKWHLVSTDGPMHYITNTVYHALEHAPTSAWVYFDDPANDVHKQCVKYCDIAEAIEMCTTPSKTFNYVTKAGYRYEIDPKTSKARNLDHARSTAVWPDATDEELTTPGLEERLKARLPQLMAEFRADMESFGFVY